MKWTPISEVIPLPEYVNDALKKLTQAGFEAYVVGGSVRDFFLKREVKDHDIATDATPDEIEALFPGSITVGKRFGVIKIPVSGKDEESSILEIATFRKDLKYKDHRHPVGIEVAGPEEDAARRDFTVNALYYSPKKKAVLDLVGGLDDIKAKTIRAIGDPSKRFQEDALRLLRAVRFSVNLDFRLEPATFSAIQEKAKLMSYVSAERIRDELTMLWKGPKPEQALHVLSKTGLLALLLPEVEAVKRLRDSPQVYSGGDVWNSTIRLLEFLARQTPDRSVALCWAAVLHDIGKPYAWKKSGGRNFNGFEVEGSQLALKVAQKYKLSGADCERVKNLVQDQVRFREVFQMREVTLMKFLGLPYFSELLELHYADAASSDGNLVYYEFCSNRFEDLKKNPLPAQKLINGEDLVQLGLKPGPKFTEIFDKVEELFFEKKISTKEEALEYVLKHFVG